MIATPPKARPFFQSMFTDRVVSAVAQPRVTRDPVAPAKPSLIAFIRGSSAGSLAFR